MVSRQNSSSVRDFPCRVYHDMEIGGFIPFSLQDYPGAVAAIVFTRGCNFRCPFCHNKGLIPLDSQGRRYDDEKEQHILKFLHRRKGYLNGIVVSGGEPTIQEGLVEFLDEVKSLGYLVKLDTNGSHPDILQKVIEKKLVDMVAMDIKAPWDKYRELSGIDVDVNRIKRSILVLETTRVPHIFRTTFVPGLLVEDDIKEIKSMLPSDATHVVQPFMPNLYTAPDPASHTIKQ